MQKIVVVFSIVILISSCGVIDHIREAQQRNSVSEKTSNKKEGQSDSLKTNKNPVENKANKGQHPTTEKHEQKRKYAYFEKKWKISLNGKENLALLKEIDNWLGVPYKYGGTTKKGVDCSGFANAIYETVYNINLSRNSAEIWQQSKEISEIKNLKDGDLLFFKIDYKNISHVGVYISNGNFAHASTSKGVVISNLEEDYYKKRFFTGGRIRK